jgi:DNA processing protein
MQKKDLPYYLGFSHFLGIGPIKFSLLKKHFSTCKKAYLARKKELIEIIGVSLTEKFIRFRNEFNPIKKLEEINKKGITILTVDGKDYPESVKNISDPPICLYLKGSIGSKNMSSPFFAIVGTRNPTTYGIQVAHKFAYELAASGFVIVSGMAYGIDTIVHQSCLEAGGKTIAVLGCGVDIIYPPSNKLLYEKIIRSGGAIISEFPPGQFVLKGFFVARNRIISALSSGVMIIEGTINSGSLITARYAAEQGKEVFAPPNPITSNMSAAPNLLLKEGAKLVTTVEDILEEFNMKITPRKKEDIKKNLSKIGKLIFDILQKNSQTIDDLAIGLNKTVPEVLNAISVMEIEGVIEKNQENKYQIRI